MKPNFSLTTLPAILLAATLLEGATPQQARITLVERNAASSAVAGAQPSVVHKQVPGEPDHEAYRFSQTVHVGSPVTEVVRVAFHQATTLKSIEASNDFHVASSSCRIGRTYNEGDSCDVSITLDPKGPGKRAGLLTFTSNESATPDVVGLQGQTMGAVLSFIPSQIETVTQTNPGGKPLFSSVSAIATDQGDNVYVVDSAGSSTSGGSGLVYFMDSSLQMLPMLGGGATHLPSNGGSVANSSVYLASPSSIAVDPFLDLYTVEYYGGLDMTSRGNSHSIAGLGNTSVQSCPPNSPCTALNTYFNGPESVNVDDQQNLFIDDANGYYMLPWVPGSTLKLNTINFGNLFPGASFGLDSTDNLYAADSASQSVPAQCTIDGIDPSTQQQWDAAGSGICGLAGNNVRSQNAEIQSFIGEYAFDAAGDMYFADGINNTIRRVDSYNGLIRTVGGGVPPGNYGDGGPATAAHLNSLVGMAVDSMGSVYMSQTAAGVTKSPSQILRKIGPAGQQNFPTMLVVKTSPVETVLLTNPGNDNLSVSNVLMGGANPGDFIPDPATSSCTWSAPLASGRSCQLGYQCKPTAAGMRTATITFVDNTSTFQNVLNLGCYALSAPAATTVTIAPPASGAMFIAGSNISLQANVSNSIPASPPTPPTGSVNMTLTNTGTSTTVATYNNLLLLPAVDINKTSTSVQTFKSAPLGSYSVSASYGGDALDAASTATPVTFSVVQVTPTVTITTPASNSKFLPGSVTATVKVSNAGLLPTAPSPTGTLTVTLTNAGTLAKTTFNPTMPAGSGGVTTTNIPLGNISGTGCYNIAVSYSGDTADKAASANAIQFCVVQLNPTVTITSPAATSYSYLTPLTYSASISNQGLTPADPNAPSGQVTFNLTNLATNTLIAILGPYTLGPGTSNVVNISVPTSQMPAVGSYSIVAFYHGDTDDAPTSSSALDFNVTPVTPTINWPTPSWVYTGTALSSTQLDATATYNSVLVPGTYVYNPPSGTVMNTPGSIPLNVTFYPTDSTDYNQANGSVLLDVQQQISGPPPTSIVLSADHNPAVAGQSLTFAALVTSKNSVEPTGSVSLLEDGKLLASAPLKGGKVTLSLADLAAGTHSLVATYSGDVSHGASKSETLKLVVSSGGNQFTHDPGK